jgi:hypothetical protein
VITVEAERIPAHGRGRLVAAWQPGQSGNPSGPVDLSAYHEARRICAQASPRAAEIQVQLMDDDDARIRLMATESVLNRGVGKPRDHTADDRNQRVSLAALTPDELTSLATLLKRALGIV